MTDNLIKMLIEEHNLTVTHELFMLCKKIRDMTRVDYHKMIAHVNNSALEGVGTPKQLDDFFYNLENNE